MIRQSRCSSDSFVPANRSVAPPYGARFTAGTGYAGGPAESAVLKSLLAPSLGVSAQDVPDLGVLLVGPMARGAEVSLR